MNRCAAIVCAAMPHRSEHGAAERPLEREEAEALAEAMRAFGAASRLRLLWAMLTGERTVEQLVELTGLAPSAASQQLRLLRQGRLVAVRRDGRHAYYRLHDHHVSELLAAIRHHHEHVHPPDAAFASEATRETAAP
jgi:DNA-binding transcriptional ArsR family regulator